MKLNVIGGLLAILAIVLAIVAYMSLFTLYQTQQALVIRLGDPIRIITEPGLNVKVPVIDTVFYVDNRIKDLENAPQEVIASDQKRLVVDAFARYRIRNPLLRYWFRQNRINELDSLTDKRLGIHTIQSDRKLL
jgi:membrane protease subunit HflC